MFDNRACFRRQWSGDGYPRRPQPEAGRRRASYKSRAPSGRASEASGCGRTGVTCSHQHRGGIAGVCSSARAIKLPVPALCRALCEKRQMCSLRRGRNVILPGQYADVETGLNYNYRRDYDPATGRYVESDPVGLIGGINTYVYVAANPLNSSDQLGLAPSRNGKWSQCAPSDDVYCEKECGSRGVASCRKWWSKSTEVTGGEVVVGWKPAKKPSCNCKETACNGACKIGVAAGIGALIIGAILAPEIVIPACAIGGMAGAAAR
jgi:RHS repeat-associated protein